MHALWAAIRSAPARRHTPIATPTHRLLLPAHPANGCISHLREADPGRHEGSSHSRRTSPSCTTVMQGVTLVAASDSGRRHTASTAMKRYETAYAGRVPSASMATTKKLRVWLWHTWRIGTCIVSKLPPRCRQPASFQKCRNNAGGWAPNIGGDNLAM